MHRYFQFTLTGLTASALFIACEQSTTRQQSGPSITAPSFTVASGFVSTPVARGTAEAFHIRSTDGFDVEIKTKRIPILRCQMSSCRPAVLRDGIRIQVPFW